MKEAYQAGIKVCPVWKDIYAAPEKSRKHMQERKGFLYCQDLNQEQRLFLPSTFNAQGNNFPETALAKAHTATADGRVKKTMQAHTNMFECQSFFHLVKEYVGRCYACKRTKYLQRGPIGYVIALCMPVRLWSDIIINFLKLSTFFIKCLLLNSIIPVGEDHIVCISRV